MNRSPTAGPWRVGDAGHSVFGPRVDGSLPELVASNLERKNARLIAAAPELVKLAESVHMGINGLHCTMRSTNRDYAASTLRFAMDELIRLNAAVIASIGGGA